MHASAKNLKLNYYYEQMSVPVNKVILKKTDDTVVLKLLSSYVTIIFDPLLSNQ